MWPPTLSNIDRPDTVGQKSDKGRTMTDNLEFCNFVILNNDNISMIFPTKGRAYRSGLLSRYVLAFLYSMSYFISSQNASSRFLNVFKDGASMTSFGRLFQLFIARIEKEFILGTLVAFFLDIFMP